MLLSWMMDEFIHWPKPYPLLSATCDEILSWRIDIWMRNQLVSDSFCNTQIFLQRMTNNVGLAFSVGDTTPRFTMSIEQDD